MITLIIPLRLSKNSLYDEVERLERIINTVPKENFTILIVDYGTGKKRLKELKDLSKKYPDVEILHTSHMDVPFSIGEARDIGVQHARTPVIMLHDLDCLCETGTYDDIYREAKLRKFDKQIYDYFCLPVIYLTEEGSRIYLSQHNDDEHQDADRFIHNSALKEARNHLIEHHTPGTSILVINRYFYLLSGGHDRSFTGHGAEDFEFYNRLSAYADKYNRPTNFLKNIPLSSGRWEGFRGYFALYGLDIWMRGIALVHLHHPRREQQDPTYKKSQHNFDLLTQKLRNFNGNKQHLLPLKDPYLKTRFLLLLEPRSSALNSLLSIFPSLGYYEIIHENDFSSSEALIDFFKNNKFTHILFLNPYGNEFRLQLFNAVRDEGLNYYCFDRGALPDSWFFDDSGMLNNSLNYETDKWNTPLSREQKKSLNIWLEEYINSDQVLEKNDKRKFGEHWRNEFQLGKRKIILVTLQRPSDTATRYFAGPSKNYKNFLNWINELSLNLDQRYYKLLIKKHPLEKDKPSITDAIYAPDNANIHDLIDISDKVITLNSGTGLLSLAMKTPVIVCGEAWYNKGKLVHEATNPKELIDLSMRTLKINKAQTEQFIYYLKEKFYSFGKSKNRIVKLEDGTHRNICNKIEFTAIRCLPNSPEEFEQKPSPASPNSFFFPNTTSPDRANNQKSQNAVSNVYGIRGWRKCYTPLIAPIVGQIGGKTLKDQYLKNPVAFFSSLQEPHYRFIGKILYPETALQAVKK